MAAKNNKKSGGGNNKNDGEDYDYLYKLVVTGDGGVGKSNLLLRYARNEFFMDSKPTIGVEFASKNVTIESKIIKAQIWDTAGQDRFRAITEAYYRSAVGALVVYDITRRESFDHIEKWLEELYDNVGKQIIVILVGNKCDLNHRRVVRVEDGQAFAEKHGLAFLETSALDSTNVDEAFNYVLREVYQGMARKTLEATPKPTDTIQLGTGQTIPKKAENSQDTSKSSPCC